MKKQNNINWRLMLSISIAFLAIIFIYFQWDTITKSLNAIKSANLGYLLIAIFVYSLSVFAAAGVSFNLKIVKDLKYRLLLLVQTATLFLGRITPASVGGPAAIARVLFTQGHTAVQSGTVLAAAGIATFMGNVLLAILALMISLQTFSINNLKPPGFVIFVVAVLLLVFIVLISIKAIRNRLNKIYKEFIGTLNFYKHRKKSIFFSVICGATVTLAFSFTLIFAAKSLGVDLSLFQAIIITSLGSLGVAVTPLPGGVVGAEAALAATMVQFGVSAESALAIAFVYRFIIFWLPLIPGFIASQYVLKKQLL